MSHLQCRAREEISVRLSARMDVRKLRLLLFLLEERAEVAHQHRVTETTRPPRLDSSQSQGSSVTSTLITVPGYRILRRGATKDPLDSRKAVEKFPDAVGWPRSRRVRAGRITNPQQCPDHGGHGPDSKTPSSPYPRVVQVQESCLGTPMPSVRPRVIRRTAKAVTR